MSDWCARACKSSKSPTQNKCSRCNKQQSRHPAARTQANAKGCAKCRTHSTAHTQYRANQVAGHWRMCSDEHKRPRLKDSRYSTLEAEEQVYYSHLIIMYVLWATKAKKTTTTTEIHFVCAHELLGHFWYSFVCVCILAARMHRDADTVFECSCVCVFVRVKALETAKNCKRTEFLFRFGLMFIKPMPKCHDIHVESRIYRVI